MLPFLDEIAVPQESVRNTAFMHSTQILLNSRSSDVVMTGWILVLVITRDYS